MYVVFVNSQSFVENISLYIAFCGGNIQCFHGENIRMGYKKLIISYRFVIILQIYLKIWGDMKHESSIIFLRFEKKPHTALLQ